MGRRKVSSIKITEVREGNVCRVHIFDEISGRTLSKTLQCPVTQAMVEAAKQDLIEQIKETNHATIGRHRKAALSELGTPLPTA